MRAKAGGKPHRPLIFLANIGHDPIQAKVFMFMPVIFTFLLATFPAGLVIYWTWNNLLSIIQQSVIMTRMGVKISLFGKDEPEKAK